jgi:hypothetical protein
LEVMKQITLLQNRIFLQLQYLQAISDGKLVF